MLTIVVLILVMVFSVVSMNLDGQSLTNEMSDLSSQFTFGNGPLFLLEELYYCPYC